ncbi:MAG: transglutaminase family protein [Zetaproteobacteria bacterium CG_4_9_14_3_um_filter_53_7]|nr:MAG: transglutaminase family protein [Zetaproteobacteria bacterium CG_4_9_14_3_um_filter_53_7]
MNKTRTQKELHATMKVRHSTRFDYSGPVALAYSEVRMMPVDTPLQSVEHAVLTVSPACSVGKHVDYYGNIVHHFNIIAPHDYVEIVSESVVHTSDRISGYAVEQDPRPMLQQYAEFLHWSKGVPVLAEYETVPNRITLQMDEKEFADALYELAAYFYRNFRYDPDVTHVHSTPKEFFEHGGGVCQDMAHAMIGVLRLAGIPARYVSGYIYDSNRAEEEGQHLRGAAATHAWVQAWHPTMGWCGIDPTNDKLVDWQYIRTAIGRDYFDVTPVKGIFRGNVEQQLTVKVQVDRIK